MLEIKKKPIKAKVLKKVCSRNKNLTPEQVRLMLRYNVMTVNQVAVMSGLDPSHVANLSVKRSTQRSTTALNRVHPFAEFGIRGENRTGKIFIANDEAFENFILSDMDV